MLWDADKLMYSGVSYDAAFSGDTLIWIMSGSPVYRITKITKQSDVEQHTAAHSGSTVVIGCPEYGTFVSNSFTTDTSGNTYMLYKTLDKTLKGDYIVDSISDLATFEVWSMAGSGFSLKSLDYSGSNFLERGTEFTTTWPRLYFNGSVTSWFYPGAYVEGTTGFDCIVAGHTSVGQGEYEDIYLTYYSGSSSWTPPSGTSRCFFYKIEPIT